MKSCSSRPRSTSTRARSPFRWPSTRGRSTRSNRRFTTNGHWLGGLRRWITPAAEPGASRACGGLHCGVDRGVSEMTGLFEPNQAVNRGRGRRGRRGLGRSGRGDIGMAPPRTHTRPGDRTAIDSRRMTSVLSAERLRRYLAFHPTSGPPSATIARLSPLSRTEARANERRRAGPSSWKSSGTGGR
jgi:hypothetical protein